MEFWINLFKERILKDIFSLVFYGTGVIAFLKLTIWVNSHRLFSFYHIYVHKHKYCNHVVFKNIDFLQYSKNVAIDVIDTTKKEIVTDLFKLEMVKIRHLLKMNLKQIFKKNKTEYLRSFDEFNVSKIIEIFYNEYIISRELIKTLARIKFNKYGMPQHDFNRLWGLYEEITRDYEIMLYENLNRYKNHKDIYKILWSILDDFNIYLQIVYKTLGNRFNRLNGRSFGISYKGGTIGYDGK